MSLHAAVGIVSDLSAAEADLREMLRGENPDLMDDFREFVEHSGTRANETLTTALCQQRVRAIISWGRDNILLYFREFCLRREEIQQAELLRRLEEEESLSFLDSVELVPNDDPTQSGKWAIAPWQPDRPDDDQGSVFALAP